MNTQMNSLVDKYMAGETTLAEEQTLKSYLLSDEVAHEHVDLGFLFSFYDNQTTMVAPADLTVSFPSSDSDMDVLVQRYMDGESSLVEEQELKTYFASGQVKEAHLELKPLFSFYGTEATRMMDVEVNTDFASKSLEPKIRHLFPKVMTVAASLALLLMFTFNFMSPNTDYHNKYTELEDPAEAMEITKQALAFLGQKYDKGAKSMIHIKELEKTNVFRLN